MPWEPAILAALEPFHPAASGRAGMVGLLAGLMSRPPERALLAVLRSDGLAAAAGESYGEDLASELRGLPAPSAPVVLDAAADYTALFKAPGPAFLRPWESVHREPREVDGRSEDGLLCGRVTRAAAHFYNQAGADLDTLRYPELPDHAGTELAFLGFLANREAEGWRAGRVEEAACDLAWQVQFLDEHVLPWIPALLGRMAENAATPSYRALGHLGVRVLEHDDRFLAGVRAVLGRTAEAGA